MSGSDLGSDLGILWFWVVELCIGVVGCFVEGFFEIELDCFYCGGVGICGYVDFFDVY